MSSKLRYKEDSPFVGWLKEQTASQRFDARCVEAIDDMDRAERQVQVDGQINPATVDSMASKACVRSSAS